MHLPGFGAQARAQALRRAAESTRSTRCARPSRRAQVRELRGFGAKVEEQLEQRSPSTATTARPPPRVLLSPRARASPSRSLGALRAHPARRPRRGRRLPAPPGRLRQGPRRHRHGARPAGARARRSGSCELVESVQHSGDAGARVTTHTGMKIDLKVVEPDQFGNVLQHFTGSKAPQRRAARGGGPPRAARLRVRDPRRRDGRDPALRDRGGGLRAARAAVDPARAARGPRRARGRARARTLPALVTLEDLRGDLHCHTIASDGLQTVEEMARAARERGLEYIAITDHSASHGFGNHVSPDELRAPDRARSTRSTSGSRASSC